MRPNNLKTRIFLDGADPGQTKEAISLLGFLDGQTTNPSLVAKRLTEEKFTQEELLNLYKKVVSEAASLIPDGSVSIQVYSDKNTKAEYMLEQGKEMYTWIPNAHIKYPVTYEGLKAAEQSVKLGIRVNMTLIFSQSQAAAVYSATKGAEKGQVIISPFIGRLDDTGENGMELIKNITQMYKSSDHHVAVLTASVRNLKHFLYALSLGFDIITAPFNILKEWAEKGLQVPDKNFIYDSGNLKTIPYQALDLDKDWHEFNIAHQLTDSGVEKFASDWKALI